ncbi:MAG: nuclear transport factor 2 family protein [Opitutales bacterium]|nr:nuclear transport factor 2 family protein [Opitutales bacterium]
MVSQHSLLTTEEEQVRELIEIQANAIRNKDAEAAISIFDRKDVVLFEIAPPLQYEGPAAVTKNELIDWFASFSGPIDYEVQNLRIHTDNGLAICHSLNHLKGQRTDGSFTDIWVRSTTCFRKANGTWKIVHEHTSVPFYMDGSLKAAVDLRPIQKTTQVRFERK